VRDGNDLPASDVVDFTPFDGVTTFEPSFMTRGETNATPSVSLLTQPLHVDTFSDGFSNPSTVSGARQSTTVPPHESHAVLSLGHQHEYTLRLAATAYHRLRTYVRPSVTLRPLAEPNP
jgi:hypothetical protein